jgi:hypothetical protein
LRITLTPSKFLALVEKAFRPAAENRFALCTQCWLLQSVVGPKFQHYKLSSGVLFWFQVQFWISPNVQNLQGSPSTSSEPKKNQTWRNQLNSSELTQQFSEFGILIALQPEGPSQSEPRGHRT